MKKSGASGHSCKTSITHSYLLQDALALQDALDNLQQLVPMKESQRHRKTAKFRKHHLRADPTVDVEPDGPFGTIPDSEFVLDDAKEEEESPTQSPPEPPISHEAESSEDFLQKCRKILQVDHLRSQWVPMLRHSLVHPVSEDHKLLLKLCKERFRLVPKPVESQPSAHFPSLAQTVGNMGVDGVGETAGNMGVGGQGQIGNLDLNGIGGWAGNLGIDGVGHSVGESITDQTDGLGNLGNAGIEGKGGRIGNLGVGGQGGPFVTRAANNDAKKHFDFFGKGNFFENLLPGLPKQQVHLGQQGEGAGHVPVDRSGDAYSMIGLGEDNDLAEHGQLFITNKVKNKNNVGRSHMQNRYRKPVARFDKIFDSKCYVGSYALGGKGAQIGNLAINGFTRNTKEPSHGSPPSVQIFLVPLKDSKAEEYPLLPFIYPLNAKGAEVNSSIEKKEALAAKFKKIGGRRDWVMLDNKYEDR